MLLSMMILIQLHPKNDHHHHRTQNLAVKFSQKSHGHHQSLGLQHTILMLVKIMILTMTIVTRQNLAVFVINKVLPNLKMPNNWSSLIGQNVLQISVHIGFILNFATKKFQCQRMISSCVPVVTKEKVDSKQHNKKRLFI